MKKQLISFLIFSILIGCASNKPNHLRGNISKSSGIFILKDSLGIITPDVQVHDVTFDGTFPRTAERDILRSLIIETLKSELKISDYYDLPLIYEGYPLREYLFEEHRFTKGEIKAPDELLISEKKNTILISIYVTYGKLDTGYLYATVINNADKIIESVISYQFEADSLGKINTVEQIKIALSKIINT